MELDDLKNTWNEMDNQVKGKQNLTLKTFDKMSKRKFHSKLYKIILPEILGSLICISSAFFIGFNFDKLNGVFYQIIGVLGISIFVIVTTISLLSLQNLNKVGDVGKPYVETLKDFATQKIKFHKLQKLNLRFSYLQLVIVVLLLPKFFKKRDTIQHIFLYIFIFLLLYLFAILLQMGNEKLQQNNPTNRRFIKRVNGLNDCNCRQHGVCCYAGLRINSHLFVRYQLQSGHT